MSATTKAPKPTPAQRDLLRSLLRTYALRSCYSRRVWLFQSQASVRMPTLEVCERAGWVQRTRIGRGMNGLVRYDITEAGVREARAVDDGAPVA